MNARIPVAVWMAAAFCAAVGLAAGQIAISGVSADGIMGALRATARLAFVLFWAAYAGSALVALFGPVFQPLKRHGREFGLAFVSAQFVHLGLVAWLYGIGAGPGIGSLVFFGTAAVFANLIALFSIARLQRALGPKGWRLLRTVGMHYLALAFAFDLLRVPLHGFAMMAEYLPFSALAIAGPGLRFATFAQRQIRTGETPPYPAA